MLILDVTLTTAVLTMFYSDDLCVIAPSPSGLQALLNRCSKYGFENDFI